MATPRRAVEEPRHLPWLDWARFLAALVVLTVHSRSRGFVEFGSLPPGQKTPLVAAAFACSRLGNEAVLLFFVLSGYLVAGKVISRLLASEFRVGDYALDRFTRIYCPYLPALVLTWGCARALGDQPSVSSFVCNLLCLQGVWGDSFGGNGPLWSIAYEVWFYVLAGSLGGLIEFKGRGSFRIALAMGVAFLSLSVFTVLSSTYLFCWLIGGLAYFYHRRDQKILGLAIILAIYSIAGTELRLASTSVSTVKWLDYFPSAAVLQLLMAGSFAAVITQIVGYKPTSRFARRMDAMGTTLASFSYTLYLTHFVVLNTVEAKVFPRASEISWASVRNWLAMCSIAIVVALIMYGLFERNTTAFKRWLRRLIAGSGWSAAAPLPPGSPAA